MLDTAQIRVAANLIRDGKLVAFPTETVYGLGANALDAAAIAKIYEVKGRPSTSPLIVHCANTGMAVDLVENWPHEADLLASRFWPGPLTIVLRKKPILPDGLTAGLPTVGLRVPKHPMALALLNVAGVPIAAPSANRFTEISPTTAEHVRQSLGERIDMILDGGPTQVGIESTVISLAQDVPLLLRPGMITQAEIELVLGRTVERVHEAEGAHPSPGLHERHYSPHTALHLVTAEQGPPKKGNGAFLYLTQPQLAARVVAMPKDAGQYAQRLYDVLHQEDAKRWDWIAVELPPDEPAWAGIRDRLHRASV